MRRFVPALLLLLVPGLAQASLFEEESPVRFDATIAADWWFPQDDAIQDVYGKQGKMGLRIQAGVVWFKKAIPVVHLETNVLMGWTVKKGAEVGVSSGSSSGESTRIGLMPLGFEALLAFDAFPEQILVPFAAIGLDAVPWNVEDADGAITKGTDFGWHGRAGLALLLDPLEPTRAGLADARSGVNDAYLVFAGQNTRVPAFGDTSGLDLSGWSFQVGLKLLF